MSSLLRVITMLPPMLLLVPLLGCAPMQRDATGATGAGGEPSPRWRAAGELVSDRPAPAAPVSMGGVGGPLGAELAARCAGTGPGDTLVRDLVAELDARGIEPARATEALIGADCGSAEQVVREMVAGGGDAVMLAVVDRAVAVQGSGFAPRAEQAAADGLGRWRRMRQLEPESDAALLAGASPAYSMIYFPLGGGGRTQRATSLSRLFDAGAPGYGVYTYILLGDAGILLGDAGILLGDAGSAPRPKAAETYRELLRVIETYVLASEQGTRDANPQGHTFLVPVHGDDGGSLLERTGPELSRRMRGELSAWLRAGGRLELAQRLERAPGPFLVSSLEPRLLPVEPGAPRMLVDLSEIGPEYMYSVVDAYDRIVPAEAVGDIASLGAIRTRLLGIFPDQAIDATASAPAEAWIYLFGRPRDSVAQLGGRGLLAAVAH